MDDLSMWLDDFLSDEEPTEPTEDVGMEREISERIHQQEDYEAELAQNYSPDDPHRLFPHNFLNENYISCTVVKHPKKNISRDKLIERVREECYTYNSRGNPVLNQFMLCDLWHETYGYEYMGGNVILTPDGAITQEDFFSEMIRLLHDVNVETKNMDQVTDRLMRTYKGCFPAEKKINPNRIPFANGDMYINEDKKGFTFHDGEKSAVPYRFPCRFKNIKNCLEPNFPKFRMWLDDLFEPEDQFTVKQLLGYLLIPSNEAQEAFFVIGKAGTGKSILTDCIIKNLIGDGCFPISLGQFFNDKFQLASSQGKLCMVDDDIGGTKLSKDDSGRFKNFITSDMIKVEAKYCAPTEIPNFARIVCSGNNMINSDDKTDGFTRRLHPIYVKPVDIKSPDTKLKKKIKGEIDMIVLWALEGLLEVIQNGYVPYRSAKTNGRFSDYAESQKWEERFIRDCYVYKEGSSVYSKDIGDKLAEWLKENADLSNDLTLSGKIRCVLSWLKTEGNDKMGFSYKSSMKRGNNYGARGFINMAEKDDSEKPKVFHGENGKLHIKAPARKRNDNAEDV